MANRIISIALLVGCAFVGFALLRPITTLAPRDGDSLLQPLRVDQPAMLERRISEIRLKDVTLEDALAKLADMAGVNLCVEWRILEGAGSDPQAHVTLNLHDATLRQAIDSCIKQSLPQDVTHPDWIQVYSEDGIVTVASAESLSQRRRIGFFQVRPLIDRLIAGELHRHSERGFPTQAEVVEQLCKFITSTVAPDSWRDSGGTLGQISELGGVLIIEHTPERLAEIRMRLDELHRSIDTNYFSPTTGPSNAGPVSGQLILDGGPKPLVVEYFNIRSIVDESGAVDPAWWDAEANKKLYTRDKARSEVANLLTQMVDATSWRENGGTDGVVLTVGDILIITQTPQDMQLVRNTLDRLHETSVKDGLKTVVQSNGKRADGPELAARTDELSSETITVFINIRSLLARFGAGRKVPNALYDDGMILTRRAVDAIRAYITQTVAPDSWEDTGGRIGKLSEADGVLVVTQTPENIQAVRSALANLSEAIARNHNSPTTSPARLPTTINSRIFQ